MSDYMGANSEQMNVGLEQPNANWAKLGRTAWRSWEEGLPGCPEVIAHCARTKSYQYSGIDVGDRTDRD